jgi:SAM-dependent methyltransferase
MDIRDYNRNAWDQKVKEGDKWTVRVGPEAIARARRGIWEVVLTPTKPVPRDWFPPLPGLEVLCLASAGGQQAPILAAVGAAVTSLDNSPKQLEQDRLVAEREGLEIRTVEGDMRELVGFADASFGLVFHPVSNCFVPEVRSVWKEAFRVLRPGGILLAGFTNPVLFVFDDAESEQGRLVARHKIPYSDVTSLTEAERRRYTDKNEPLVYGHTLEDQIGGQLNAGFVLTGMYEDVNPEHPLAKLLPTSIATRAAKPMP